MYEEKKEFNVLKGIVPDFNRKYQEKILNEAYSLLAGNLIPVEIDDNELSLKLTYVINGVVMKIKDGQI